MEGAEQQLFLMEFLVDRVNVPSVRAMHEEMLPVTTCVSFQILNLPPIDICQETATQGCMCIGGDTQLFKKGKSCLFALPSVVVEKPLYSFPVTMSVYKKLPPGVLPDVMLIGTHQIETKDLFNVLLNRHIFKSGNASRTMKETFRIKTATGQNVGEVTAFIRVSCFGKKIVTQFQIPHNKKPYLFKGVDNSPVFQCKKISSDAQIKTTIKCPCLKESLAEPGASGEASPRTCCATQPKQSPGPPPRSPGTYKPPNYSPRPCCPLAQSCPVSGQLPPPCCSLAPESPGFPPSMPSSSPLNHPVGSVPHSSQCMPTYSPTFPQNFNTFPAEPAYRKCGCIVKEEKGCNCIKK
ncbi:uncharacterized protein LOC107263388 [Cephus cinctus]|uniref:Uncharacterized protein LOC107263388 n=1 Tax=Cephus cinctus TaxID=211228 RepID=A0AAJ7FD88_CEPCN|nr:uncharacterized protein LOC107263388 [Cephus cinctus]